MRAAQQNRETLDATQPGGWIELASIRQEVEAEGFCIIPQLVSGQVVDFLLAALDASNIRATRSRGVRNLASQVPEIADLAMLPEVIGVAQSVLAAPVRLVRSILFDKVEGANWAIRWHQDVTIAVERRIDLPGYGPWSVKAGVVSVQPPASVLKRIVSIRLHLDDCTEDNGALRVIGGTHQLGRIQAAERERLVRTSPQTVCSTPAGGAVVMKPLLLHASPPAKNPSHRRVVHMDFASGSLDDGLEWSGLG